MMSFNDAEANRVEIIDLTNVLDENLSIYSNGIYSDPPLQIETWCTIQKQGYKVSGLSMGTQTGTHIDAPAHFVEDGATLEALPLHALIGQYLWVDLNQVMQSEESEFKSIHRAETILFLTSAVQAETEISQEIFDALLELPCLVWVIVYGVRVRGHEPMYFHQALSKAGKYLIEDVNDTMAIRVRAGGEMIALPLRLRGVSGSPCRVVVRQQVKQV